RAGLGHEALTEAGQELLAMANQHEALEAVRHNGQPDGTQYQLIIDQEKARALGVSIGSINDTLSIAWGSNYVNDFVDRGRVKKVYVQAMPEYRMVPEDIHKWYVRNNKGEMVSFADFADGEWTSGAMQAERYNGISSLNIQGSAAPGYSTGD